MKFSRLMIAGLAVCAAATVPPALAQGADVWMRLYNETDLSGWKGKTANWKVDADNSVQAYGATSGNTFLVSDSSFGDFHLKLEGKLGPTSNNSGIIYRGRITQASSYQMGGYQYEISGGGTGAFYHELGSELGFTRIGGCWNGSVSGGYVKMEVIADGPKATHLVAGNKCFEHSNFKVLKGQLGLQLHAPGNYTMNFRSIFIKPLNNSFQVPADNAWDADGKRIGVLGVTIEPKRRAANRSLGLPDHLLGFDASGRAVTAGAQGRPARLLVLGR